MCIYCSSHAYPFNTYAVDMWAGMAASELYLLVLDRCTGALLDSSVTMVCRRHSYLSISSHGRVSAHSTLY